MVLLNNTLIQPAEVINGGILRPTPMSSRMDETLISPWIFTAEREYIYPVLGKEFYEKLKTKKAQAVSNYNQSAGTVVQAFPLAADVKLEKLWRHHLLQICATAVLIKALPTITLQIGSNGLFKSEDQFDSSAGVKGLKYLQDEFTSQVHTLLEALREYMCDNKEDFLDCGYDFSHCPDEHCPTGSKEDYVNNHGVFFYGSEIGSRSRRDYDDYPDRYKRIGE